MTISAFAMLRGAIPSNAHLRRRTSRSARRTALLLSRRSRYIGYENDLSTPGAVVSLYASVPRYRRRRSAPPTGAGSRTGSDRSSAWSSSEKIAVFAPTPKRQRQHSRHHKPRRPPNLSKRESQVLNQRLHRAFTPVAYAVRLHLRCQDHPGLSY